MKWYKEIVETHPALTWSVINFSILAAFFLGNQYDIYILRLFGEIMFWITIILAFLGLFVTTMLTTILLTTPEKIQVVETRTATDRANRADRKNIVFELKVWRRIAQGSVPQSLDVAFDLIATAIMIYYGYTWLALFYALHIAALGQLRISAKRLTDLAKASVEDRTLQREEKHHEENSTDP